MIEKKVVSLEKAVLIGVITKLQDETKSEEYLEELEFLTYTAGGEVLKHFTQKMDKPNPKTFIGTGKITSAVVTGICRSNISYKNIIISHRNKSIAQRLKKKFKKITISKDNQEIIN